MNILDIYFKKEISYEYRKHHLQFRVSQELFSSQQIDFGTQRLLRTLALEKIDTYNKVLDLGCGYGPIGIALKKFYPSSTVHMTDRDALAVAYTQENAVLNGFSDIKAYGSLGYDGVTDTDYDLIVSNIPAKVGEKALSHILQDAQYYMRPNGKVIVVVIDPIAEYVENVLASDENIHILYKKAWPGHVVFHYEFIEIDTSKKPVKSAFERGIFDREEVIWDTKEKEYKLKTTYGLSEFDTLSFQSSMLVDRFRTINNQTIENAILFNIGQGYIPLAFAETAKPKHLFLIDRNLQALTVTDRNLQYNNYPNKEYSTHFQVGIALPKAEKVNYIAGILPDNEGIEAHHMYLTQASTQLASKGTLTIAANSTAITRAENYCHANKLFDIVERKRARGNSTLILKKKI